MALCERCQAEITKPSDQLPPPWFDHDGHKIGNHRVHSTVWAILEVLWNRRGAIVSRDSLMTLIYGHLPDPPTEQIVTVGIHYLRGALALASTPFAIQTEWGRGYRLIERKSAE